MIAATYGSSGNYGYGPGASTDDKVILCANDKVQLLNSAEFENRRDASCSRTIRKILGWKFSQSNFRIVGRPSSSMSSSG